MKNIFLSIFILATYNLSAQLSTSLSEYRPKTIIQDENCRIQFYDSTGVQVHELLCGNLKYWYEKSYPYYGGKKIVIFDGFNKIYIENDGRLTSPTFSALDDSLDVWKQCNSFKTPLTVDVVGIDTVRVVDSLRVWFNTTLYDDSAIVRRIDTTNSILSKLYFENCGIVVPSNYEGYKFDNAIDFACTGGLPSTTELVDFQSNCGNVPLAIPIPMTDQIAVQSYINSFVLPLVASCFAISTNPNDIIYIYDSANDEAQVWYNTNVSPITLGQYPTNFVVAPIGTGSACEKPVPLITVTAQPSGNNALLVKVCEPLNVNQDTTINTVIREMRDSISRQNEILLNQTTPTPTLTTPTYSSVRTTFTVNTIPTPYNVGVPSNTREITIQNITGSDIQITTSQGAQILGARNNITLSNPLNTTINHDVFTGNVTVSFYSSVGGNVFGISPRVIIDFKTY